MYLRLEECPWRQKKVSKLFCSALFLGFISLAAPSFVSADTFYTYTGNPFSGLAGESCPPVCGMNASFTVASPLADNFTGYFDGSTFESFSITDGNVAFDLNDTFVIINWNIGVQSGSILLLTNPNYDGSIYNAGSTDVPQADGFSNPGSWPESDPTPLKRAFWLGLLKAEGFPELTEVRTECAPGSQMGVIARRASGSHSVRHCSADV